jgi:predicted nucleic acid-binding protein
VRKIVKMEDVGDGTAVRTSTSGLYKGFEGYRTLSDSEYRSALTRALVVLDTNVLLDLYRYNEQTRASMIDIIVALGDRFWVPHQVLEEFWRNRERALADPLSEVRQSITDLKKQLSSAQEIMRMWVNRSALVQEAADAVDKQLAEAYSAAQRLIEDLVDADQVAKARNTLNDIVLKLLEPVLEGHVGSPMSDADYRSALAESKRRTAAGEPPGFADAKKAQVSAERAAGDYLVWEQILCETTKRKLDVVLVTGDVKKDWWRYEGSFARGPRIELTRELRRRCGVHLYMMRPDMLLTYADALAVTVEQRSVEDVERTTRTEGTPIGQSLDATGWTPRALESLLSRLSTIAPVQEATIRLAAQQDGYISREDVYVLGDYEPGRQLKGFTRPVNRLVQELRDAGELPDDAADALSPVYDKMEHGFGWVDGFQVPLEIVGLLQ